MPSKTPKSVSFFALNSRLSVYDSAGLSGIFGFVVTLGSLRLVAVVSFIGSQLSLSLVSPSLARWLSNSQLVSFSYTQVYEAEFVILCVGSEISAAQDKFTTSSTISFGPTDDRNMAFPSLSFPDSIVRDTPLMIYKEPHFIPTFEHLHAWATGCYYEGFSFVLEPPSMEQEKLVDSLNGLGREDDMLMKEAGKDCTSGAVSLLGFSAIFSAILLAQESIYGQMVAYMKESGEGILDGNGDLSGQRKIDEEELCSTQPTYNPEEDVSVHTLTNLKVQDVTKVEDYLIETSEECKVFQIVSEIVIALNEGEDEMNIDVNSDKPENLR
ncbi:hypothetical protein Syun_007337 [Stephania yunnanensis]|uniref:Uncharacterized protein n=1 Tax=Stephania yunnanensis TaxID=152371 RepID=A0AAP0KYK4_9MAGN